MHTSLRTALGVLATVVALGVSTVACGSSDEGGPPTSTTTTVASTTQEGSTPAGSNSGAATNAGNGQTDGDSGPATAGNGVDAEPDPAEQGTPGETTGGDGSTGTIPPGNGGG